MLTLVHRPGSAKYWRLAYRFNSEQKTLAFGVYPEVRLAAASKKRQVARTQLADARKPDILGHYPEEAQAGFAKRAVAKPRHEADLTKQTLANLYNERPTGRSDSKPEMPDDKLRRRLLTLNLAERRKN